MKDQPELSQRQRKIKRRFEEQRSFWTELLDDVLATDSEFLNLYR
jgi:hypothetical protein